MKKSHWKLFVSLILVFNFSLPGNAMANSLDCVQDHNLNELKPEVAGVPILYWQAKVDRELALFMVNVEGEDRPLFKLVECESAALREEKPQAAQPGEPEADSEICKTGNIRHLGDLWLPLAEYSDEDEVSRENYVLEDPTQFFRHSLRESLQEYADSMEWDPYIKTTYRSIDNLLWAVIGYGFIRIVWKHYPKTTRWNRYRRWSWVGLGIMVISQTGIEMAYGARRDFVTEANQRSRELKSLIQKIDDRMVLRLDGQDRAANLEQSDGYSALINSISKANKKTKEQFCN